MRDIFFNRRNNKNIPTRDTSLKIDNDIDILYPN